MTFRITPPEPRGQRRPILPPAARYALAAIAFLTPAAWLTMFLACAKYGDDWPGTCEPINYPLAAGAVALVVCLFMGGAYMRRAWKRANKGTWRRVSGRPVLQRLESAVATIWDERHRVGWGDAPGETISGAARFERRRWLIACPNGQNVWVDRAEFWRWLRDGVEPLQRTLPAGRSAVGIRYWKGRKWEGRKLQEGDVLAFREILKAVGAVDYRTADPRSMYYVPAAGAVWGRVEEFEKIMESEVY